MNRKGITPVIAVVLLLMMTVAAAGAAFFWITTIQSRIQGQVATQASQTASSSKFFVITGVMCGHAAPVQINVTIQNVGGLTIDSGISSIAVTSGGVQVAENTSILNSNLESKGYGSMTFYIGTNLTQNKTYGVRVTLPGGSTQTNVCIAQ